MVVAARTVDRPDAPVPDRALPRRIAFVISRADDIGGAQIHIRDLSTALRSQGVDAIVLGGRDGVLGDQLRERGVPFHPIRNLHRAVGPVKALRAVLEIRALLGEFRPDVVSTHSTLAGVVGRIAARSLGIPTLFTAHGWGFTAGRSRAQRAAFWAAEWAMAPLAARIITVCDSDLDAAVRTRLTAPARLVSIPNAMPETADSLRAVPGRTPPKIIMVARLSRQKDHGTLFHALGQLRDLEWTLELVGDGPLREEVEAAAQSAGIASRVDFAGFRPDVAERLADSQIFVLASNWEGFPRSILEAMRAGLPVIASDVGGVRESVLDGETGFVVPSGDAAALADRLRTMISDAELRTQMGEAGRALYQRRFALGRLIDETTAVYRAVMDRDERMPLTTVPT